MDTPREFCLYVSGSDVDWRNRDFREAFEINEFIQHFSRFHTNKLSIYAKSEKPDYFLKNVVNSEIIGVELTSVYLSNYSVPRLHMKEGIECIPYEKEKLEQYGERVLTAVKTKIQKAQSGYDKSYPLYLSVYINEYISIYMDEEYWLALLQENKLLFSDISPFCEILFWPVADNQALAVTASGKKQIK